MIIIIDGYNLLKQHFPTKTNLRKERKQLIEQLIRYKKAKKNIVEQIVVVFDGGTFPHANREKHDGVLEIYSGFKSNADNWITNFAEKNNTKTMILVSMDKQLVGRVMCFEVESIRPDDFYHIVKSYAEEQKTENDNQGNNRTIKFNQHQEFSDTMHPILSPEQHRDIEFLMEHEPLQKVIKDDIYQKTEKQKGESFQLSKRQKKRLEKLSKIL